MAKSHLITSDGAAKALASLKAMSNGLSNGDADTEIDHADPEKYDHQLGLRSQLGKHLAKDTTCPDCGGKVFYYWTSNNDDPGDVDPRAQCADCDFGY
jgi:hypothetical protein